jgi:hypothetical protein
MRVTVNGTKRNVMFDSEGMWVLPDDAMLVPDSPAPVRPPAGHPSHRRSASSGSSRANLRPVDELQQL